MTVEAALQTALIDKLKADATLVAMVTGVYDYVPNGTTEPYITAGDIDSEEWDTKTWDGQDCIAELHVFSKLEGRLECKQIMDRIHTVLHRKKLPVDGASTITIRYLDSSVNLEVDGITHRGVTRYSLLLQID